MATLRAVQSAFSVKFLVNITGVVGSMAICNRAKRLPIIGAVTYLCILMNPVYPVLNKRFPLGYLQCRACVELVLTHMPILKE